MLLAVKNRVFPWNVSVKKVKSSSVLSSNRSSSFLTFISLWALYNHRWKLPALYCITSQKMYHHWVVAGTQWTFIVVEACTVVTCHHYQDEMNRTAHSKTFTEVIQFAVFVNFRHFTLVQLSFSDKLTAANTLLWPSNEAQHTMTYSRSIYKLAFKF